MIYGCTQVNILKLVVKKHPGKKLEIKNASKKLDRDHPGCEYITLCGAMEENALKQRHGQQVSVLQSKCMSLATSWCLENMLTFKITAVILKITDVHRVLLFCGDRTSTPTVETAALSHSGAPRLIFVYTAGSSFACMPRLFATSLFALSDLA